MGLAVEYRIILLVPLSHSKSVAPRLLAACSISDKVPDGVPTTESQNQQTIRQPISAQLLDDVEKAKVIN